MKTKLTLSIERDVIEEAKDLALEKSTSLSAMVETLLRGLVDDQRSTMAVREAEVQYGKSLSPKVVEKMKSFQKLGGLLKDIPDDQSYDDLKWGYFKEKFDL